VFWASGIHPLIPSALRPKRKKKFENFLKHVFLSENKRKGIHQLTAHKRLTHFALLHSFTQIGWQ
jgi:hypothetical protein